jgi:hypothetical protein
VSQFFVPRSSFTIHIPETGPTGHLFVILTETCAAGNNLVVPVNTIRGAHDGACLLGVGDHAFIKSPSFVAYRHLDLLLADDIKAKVRSGVIDYKGILEDRVFALVCAGVERSEEAAPKFQRYFREQVAISRGRAE